MKNWEKDFDDKFACGIIGCDCSSAIVGLKGIKSFIHQNLIAKEELEEVIEGMFKTKNTLNRHERTNKR